MNPTNDHRGFLHELAQRLFKDGQGNPGSHTIVFPNKRAGLFFKKVLSGIIDGPVWAPQVMSMEEFVQNRSSLRPLDKLGLLTRLYPIHKKVTGNEEPFEKFYNWGEMLLGDFEDIDRNMADARQLFAVLKSQREIDVRFGGLEEEQLEIIRRFWEHFEERNPEQQAKFLRLWEKLHPLYTAFRESLTSEGRGYAGMIYREVAETLGASENPDLARPVIFAGFNALTRAEETIILWHLQHGNARIFWDADRYYLDDPKMEAGIFLRQYRNKPLFQPSFSEPVPELLGAAGRAMTVVQCPDPVAQLKHLAVELDRLSRQPGWEPEQTAIVLGDEGLLMPLLQSLPERIKQVNVTMGFPLRQSYWYGWLEHLVDLQMYWKSNTHVHSRPVINLLRHALLQESAAEECRIILDKIQTRKRVWVPIEWLRGAQILEQIFTPQTPETFFEYVKNILLAMPEAGDQLQKALTISLYQHLNRLHDTMTDAGPGITPSWEGLLKLLRKFFNTVKVPFAGEPLNGVQIMGVLETRNLDFQHVYFLSMNEEVFPGQPGSHSYIPYNLRKAFNLPGIDHHDAIYSYLFYRLIQRSRSITCYYTTGQQNGQHAEPSRYLLQMIYESGWEIHKKVLNTPFQLPSTPEIAFSGGERVKQMLVSGALQLSPTAIQTYLACKLRFYLEYVLRIQADDEITENIDGAFFGQILHKTMDFLYRDKAGGLALSKTDIESLKKELPGHIEQAFREEYGMDSGEAVEWTGHPVVVRDLVLHLCQRILELDAAAAPLRIMAIEAREYKLDYPVVLDGETISIKLKGTIDRIDATETAVRIIDYKSGKDSRQMDNLERVFSEKHIDNNKAGFQALFYSLLYLGSQGGRSEKPLQAGLYNVKEIYQDDFDFRLIYNKQPLDSPENILPEFEEHLKELIRNILDEKVLFVQTAHTNNCTYCPFKDMCGR